MLDTALPTDFVVSDIDWHCYLLVVSAVAVGSIREDKEDIALYRGAHFKDNEGFEAYWRQCEALLKKSRVPLLLPSIFAHVCTASPPPRPTTEIRSIELRPTLQSPRNVRFFSLMNYGHIGYLKNQNFMLISNL